MLRIVPFLTYVMTLAVPAIAEPVEVDISTLNTHTASAKAT